MCILYSFSITIIRDSPFFSLFSHGIRAKGEKNPNYFRFIRESILGNFSMTVYHSGHPSHLLKLSDQPSRRQKTLTAVRKPSPPATFSGDVLFRHRPYHQVRKEEIFKFSQSTGGRISSTRQPRAFLLRRVRAHGALFGHVLPPPASPDAV